MNTSYQQFVRETANWEDFVIEGGGNQGCCGVSPANYTYKSQSPFTGNGCITACLKKCPTQFHSPSKIVKLTPIGCANQLSFPKAPRICCIRCCAAYFPPATSFNTKVCKGALWLASPSINNYNCNLTATPPATANIVVFCRGKNGTKQSGGGTPPTWVQITTDINCIP